MLPIDSREISVFVCVCVCVAEYCDGNSSQLCIFYMRCKYINIGIFYNGEMVWSLVRCGVFFFFCIYCGWCTMSSSSSSFDWLIFISKKAHNLEFDDFYFVDDRETRAHFWVDKNWYFYSFQSKALDSSMCRGNTVCNFVEDRKKKKLALLRCCVSFMTSSWWEPEKIGWLNKFDEENNLLEKLYTHNSTWILFFLHRGLRYYNDNGGT